MERNEVVIVGAGLAGLFTALKLAPMPVTVISPESVGSGSSSAWAQGGIAAAVSEGDTPQAHAADTIRAGAGIVDERIAHLLARDAPQRIDDLLSYGVPFDRDLEGKLMVSREAAHGARRIVRVRGDLAGKAIMESMVKVARETPSIRLLEGFTALRLEHDGRRITGVLLWPTGALGLGEPIRLPARSVVLACGGAGQLYQVTTNPLSARGLGLAMAARAGAVIADAEFVQFHPTALDIGRDPAPLATEALRGEGATLINGLGERFMLKVHEDAELGPRDIVARAVFEEVQSGRGAFLDCREAIGARFAEAFPGVHAACKAAGLDPATEPLPIAPGAHYHMGGVLTDANGRSTVDGLWACGEVASTGAHGANRLASNSLLETVVFGARIAEDIVSLLPVGRVEAPKPDRSINQDMGAPESALAPLAHLRAVMSSEVGVVRTGDSLRSALRKLAEIEKTAQVPVIADMALTGQFIAAAALARPESRGAHFRSDHPRPREDFARRSYLVLDQVRAVAADAATAKPVVNAA